jgi:hypothetical protein
MKTRNKKPIVLALVLATALAGCGMRRYACPGSGTIPCNTPSTSAPHRTVNLPRAPH